MQNPTNQPEVKQDEFIISSWDEIKDEYFKILIPNLESAVAWLNKLGYSVIKEDSAYWLEVNKSKKENAPNQSPLVSQQDVDKLIKSPADNIHTEINQEIEKDYDNSS